MSESISDITISNPDAQTSAMESGQVISATPKLVSKTSLPSTSPKAFDPKSLAGDAFEKHLLDPIAHPYVLPDHTQLPDNDGTFVKNFQGASPERSINRLHYSPSQPPTPRSTLCNWPGLWNLLAHY